MARKERTAEQERKQEKALLALAEGMSNRQAAKEAGVSETAIRDWKKDPEFRGRLDRMLDETLAAARQQLRGSCARVLGALVDVAIGKRKGSPQQVAAAKDLLNRVELGSGDRVHVEGDLSSLSNEQLEKIARGES